MLEKRWVASVLSFDPEAEEYVLWSEIDSIDSAAVLRAGVIVPVNATEIDPPLPEFIVPPRKYGGLAFPHRAQAQFAWMAQYPMPRSESLFRRALPRIGVSAGVAVLFVLPYILYRSTRLPANACPKCWYDRAGLAPDAACPECGTEPED